MSHRLPTRLRADPYAFIEAGANRALEWWLGVRTRDFLTPEEIGIDGRHQQPHAASEAFTLYRALRALRVHPDDVLLDLGAGKGRALVVAAHLPFRRLIGVELS